MRGKNVFIFLLVLLSSHVSGQGWLTEENNFETNWNTSFQIGPTLLVSEIKRDFTDFSNDMSNMPDICFNLQLAKMVWERIDIGMDLGMSFYNGYRFNPSDVVFLNNTSIFNNDERKFLPYPISYKSDILNLSFFLKYNFINFSSFSKGFIELNMYSKIGLGLALINSELGYREKANYAFTGFSDPLYRYDRFDSDFYSRFVISPAFGLNYQLTDRIFISFEFGFNFINADYVDGLRRYSSDLTLDIPEENINKYLIPYIDVTGKFLFGVSYFFNFDTRRETRHLALPFYYNRYRSYYSKFQKKPTKYTLHERLPFYNDNFGNLFK